MDVDIGKTAGDAVEQRAEGLAGEAAHERGLPDHAFRQDTVGTSWNQPLRRRRGIEPYDDAGGAFFVRAAVDVRLRYVLDVRGDQLELDLAAVTTDLEDRLTLPLESFGVGRSASPVK